VWKAFIKFPSNQAFDNYEKKEVGAIRGIYFGGQTKSGS
jgi:hypothetical protein